MPTIKINGYDVYYEDNDFTDPWKASEVVFLNHFGYGNLRLYYKWIPDPRPRIPRRAHGPPRLRALGGAALRLRAHG